MLAVRMVTSEIRSKDQNTKRTIIPHTAIRLQVEIAGDPSEVLSGLTSYLFNSSVRVGFLREVRDSVKTTSPLKKNLFQGQKHFHVHVLITNRCIFCDSEHKHARVCHASAIRGLKIRGKTYISGSSVTIRVSPGRYRDL